MYLNGRVRGAELSGDGNIVTPSFTISTNIPSPSGGSFWPRVATGPNGQFGFVYGIDYATAWLERYQGIQSGGGGGGGTTSAPLMAIDVPSANAQVSSNGFFVSGWALDRGAASSSGIDFVHVYAWPVGGGPATFLGAATLGVPQRPDVAAAFGSQFTGSGYSLTTGPLAAGTYDVVVYAHNTLGNTIDGRAVRVTAVAPASIPRMNVDVPSANQIVSQHLTIIGWALDLGSPSSTGVDTIHVYAYPANGGAPIFLGVANYGGTRFSATTRSSCSRAVP